MVKRDAYFRRIVAKMTFYELFSRQPIVLGETPILMRL